MVQSIRRVLSLDLVFNPARGGAFIRALNAVQTPEPGAGPQAGDRQETNMPEPASVQPPLAPAAPHWGSIPPHYPPAASGALPAEAELEAVRALLNTRRRARPAGAGGRGARALRAQMCGYLLDAGLAVQPAAGGGPGAVRKRFAGQAFEPPRLAAAIDDQRALVTALTAGAVVQGPGRIGAMFNDRERLQAAVDDLLGAPRDTASAGLARCSG